MSTIFISYATADRAAALQVCEAIERRGHRCWISTRDVPPGANYQEAIVQALRAARAAVLVFSKAANTSDEVKKELSLASRYRVPVITLRLEDIEPSDAFAYELATRQWIDAFEGRERAIDTLVDRIAHLAGATAEVQTVPAADSRARPSSVRRAMIIAGAGVLAVAIAAGIWWARSSPAPADHNMVVRLAGFQLLSADLPASLRETVDAEITAAFNIDAVVGVSTASAPPPGNAPAYALGGTIQRDGSTIRVITRMVNERSGASLWTNSFDYDGSEVARIPRHVAVDAGNVVRCGLFGASTYSKPLPDGVLRDYMQFCQAHWDPDLSEGRKAQIPAQRVVAAVPDFSWGWAAIAGGYWKVAMNADNDRIAAEARASGREAADRAVAIDARNSEALYIKAVLLDEFDWIGREELFKRAVAARRLDCGCEHHQYGWMLLSVGRTAEAVEQLHQADDMLALYVYTPLTLAQALVVADKPAEAKRYFDAAIDLAPNADFARQLAKYEVMAIGDVGQLQDPALSIPPELRAALIQGRRALAERDPAAKARAVQALLALPEAQQRDVVAKLLGELGADHEALEIAARFVKSGRPGPSMLWDRRMRGALADSAFPALAAEVGLVKYWTTTHTKPDVCGENAPPPFCATL